MSELNIVTNGHARHFLYWDELSERDRTNFDYLTTDDERQSEMFFKYRGTVYALGEFQVTSGEIADMGYSGVLGMSYFDAIAIKVCDGIDTTVKVAHLYW